jgi:hypothetical protein
MAGNILADLPVVPEAAERLEILLANSACASNASSLTARRALRVSGTNKPKPHGCCS